jgi:TrmH family RNA methyltransferase
METRFIRSEDAEYQIIQSLKLNRSKRTKLKEIFIEGTEGIKQLVRAGWPLTRIIHSHHPLSDWAKNLIAAQDSAKILAMPPDLYKNLCDKNNPSELLVTAERKQLPIPKDLPRPFFVVFDRPGDLGNLGTMIRSANAFKVDGIYIAGHGVDVYDPKVIRSSLGGVFFTPIQNIGSMEEMEGIIQNEKAKNGLQVIGADSAGSISMAEQSYQRPVMVILGNEAKGISQKLKSLCDGVLRIPMSGNVNSLNVSNAASIIMWEIFKKDR